MTEKSSSQSEASGTPDFRETLYTISKDGHRKWVYAGFVKGKFFKRRVAVVTLLLLIYLGMPWLTVGGEQAVMLNIADRKFVFFGVAFYPTDTALLFLIIASLAITLFFASALFGRMWCGWACPETVFLEFVFRPIERWIEGSPAQRLKLDQNPFTAEWFTKKIAKFAIYAAIAWLLASTALAYFWGRSNLIGMMGHSPSENFGPFSLTLALMGVMLFQFGWFREQFCTVACPYARFQSVLIDPDSLIVGYDKVRGEPRGKPGPNVGDCVDCGLCVRVCPTGIDIRNGLQLECVQCTACMDACDSVMRKLSKPLGLIRYDSERNLLRREGLHWLRPRVFVYGAILLGLVGIFTGLMLTRSLTDFKIVRGGLDAPFSMMADGSVMNHLHARIGNKAAGERAFGVKLVSIGEHAAPIPDARLTVPENPFPVPAGEEKTLPLFISFPPAFLTRGMVKATVELEAPDGEHKIETVTLLGPAAEVSHDEDSHHDGH